MNRLIVDLSITSEQFGRAIAKASAAFKAWGDSWDTLRMQEVRKYERRQQRAQNRSRRNQPRWRKHGRPV